jgi:uncharacterized membrane protein YeaQ/YmgE (transglycosylase-associated protein family)
MLHLIWYIIVGFLAGCVAKALLHVHLSIMWTIVLGMVGSIVGGAVTHIFSPASGKGRFHPAGRLHPGSDRDALCLAPVQIANPSRVKSHRTIAALRPLPIELN